MHYCSLPKNFGQWLATPLTVALMIFIMLSDGQADAYPYTYPYDFAGNSGLRYCHRGDMGKIDVSNVTWWMRDPTSVVLNLYIHGTTTVRIDTDAQLKVLLTYANGRVRIVTSRLDLCSWVNVTCPLEPETSFRSLSPVLVKPWLGDVRLTQARVTIEGRRSREYMCLDGTFGRERDHEWNDWNGGVDGEDEL